MAHPKTAPHLTPKLIANETALVALIDRLLRGSARQQSLTEDVLKAQEELHECICPDQWEVFRRLDGIVADRFAQTVLLVARWAFDEGMAAQARARW